MAYDLVIESLSTGVPRCLVNERSLAAAARRFSQTPWLSCNYLGFERPLGSRDVDCDFAFNLDEAALGALAHDRDGWSSLSRFARAWRSRTVDHAGPARGAASDASAANIWLEFDLSESYQNHRPPSVFFAAKGSAIADGVEWSIDTALPSLGVPVAGLVSPMRRIIARAQEHGVKAVQFGVMLARAAAGLRLCLIGLPSTRVPAFLAEIGWHGDRAAADGLVARYGDTSDFVGLHLDLAPDLLPTLGLELLFEAADPWDWQPSSEPRWDAMGARLRQDGLADPAVWDALLAWPRRRPFTPPLIDRLVRGATGTGAPEGTLVTGLQHVKLSLGRGPPQAKAYFGAQLRPTLPAGCNP